ncbi:MAG: fused MFS/spermidine synthase [Chthoniobacteraceae bacterium]
MSSQKSSPPPESLHPWLLRGLTFFSGGAVMLVEVAGNRLLSPGFGNSLYTWTGLIGVILVALSCGDYLGGWLVDRVPRFSLLPLMFGLGGLLTAAVPGLVKLWPSFEKLDLVTGPITVSLALFFLPGLVLATITPVSIRLLSRARSDEHIGQSAGTVGMAAALGSFAGTLATSYVLIPRFGVRHIFVGLGVTLCALAVVLVLVNTRTRRKSAALLAIAIAGFAVAAWSAKEPPLAPGIVFAKDTFYHRISVTESDTVRTLHLDSTMEGAQVIATGELVFGYQHYWRLAEVFCPRLDRAVFLGAGAFGMPERMSLRFPDARITAVEIDPEVIGVGRRYFRLAEFANIHAVAADARRYLRTSDDRFDFVFGDAYNGVQFVPPHLVTREFFGEVGARLKPGGVFVMNLIATAQGGGSQLFWRVMNGVRAAFPHTQLYGTKAHNPAEQQNFIIVASAEPLEPRTDAWLRENRTAHPDLAALLATRIDTVVAPDPAAWFTDDFNPVEYTVARQLRAQ